MPVKIGDILRNHVKEKLARGEVVASMTVRLVRGVEIARIAKTAGFDSLYVDMEHSSFSLETTEPDLHGRARGRHHAVRARARRRRGVARARRRRARHHRARMSARRPRRATTSTAAKYPPLGDRSAAGPLPHLQYRSFPAAEADAALDAATMVIVQFESDEALDERRRDRRRRRRRHGADRHQRSAGRLGPARPVRASRGCARPMPRPSPPAAATASMSASAAFATPRRTRRRIRAHGRALRLDRHRSRLSARGLHRQGQGGARDMPRQ